MSLLHPDVAVVLRYTRLRVQERHSDTALGTQSGVVAAAVLDGLLIELISKTTEETENGVNLEERRFNNTEPRGHRQVSENICKCCSSGAFLVPLK